MPFVRKKKGQVLIVHSRRGGEGRVRQEIIHRFQSQEELRFVSDDDLWERFTASMEWRHPKIGWDWNRVRESLEAEHSAWAGEPSGSVYQSAAEPTTYMTENVNIHGIRRPETSAIAPNNGAPKAMISPVMVRQLAQIVCARAAAASASRPAPEKYPAATPAK